ncbi:GNAT family N-acetyltransferase [Phytomonospora sp. NPDC050363]|uniref:GNAT family N-acetyltransferase n=1 Tax=Phytomonospora sp. NPDC050363 TaxID=3155642 RepID=UPI0033D6B19F
MSDIHIRLATEADIPAILKMGDEAVAWLAERGRTGQWGTRTWTGNAATEERMVKRLTSCEFYIAEIDGEPAGALAVGDHGQEYVPAADEPELYVHFLITAGAFHGRQVGATLLAHARERAIAWGVELVRVDCYGGDDRKLVAFYTSQGFEPIQTFTVKDWPGQLLGYRL